MCSASTFFEKKVEPKNFKIIVIVADGGAARNDIHNVKIRRTAKATDGFYFI